jgi:hypothetical protein
MGLGPVWVPIAIGPGLGFKFGLVNWSTAQLTSFTFLFFFLFWPKLIFLSFGPSFSSLLQPVSFLSLLFSRVLPLFFFFL